ncbi:hypothetical protein D9M68_726290 [compost metagenome]
MGKQDAYEVYKAAPKATLIATHMGSLNHAVLARHELREFSAEKGMTDRLLVPEDGEAYRNSTIYQPGRQVVLLLVAAPEAMAAEENLRVVDGFQRRRGDAHGTAVAAAAEIEVGELAVVEAGLEMGGGRKPDAM